MHPMHSLAPVQRWILGELPGCKACRLWCMGHVRSSSRPEAAQRSAITQKSAL